MVLLSFVVAACQPEPSEPPPRTARVVEVDPREVPLAVDGSGQVAAGNTTSVGFLVWGPTAFAIAGGLAGATALTLPFLPAFYVVWLRATPLAAGAASAAGTPATA